MALTIPKTDWVTGELVTAEDLNAIGEHLAELRRLSGAIALYTTTQQVRTTSTEFVDVDSANLNLEIVTAGGDVMVHFSGSVNHDDHGYGHYDIEVDGTRLGDSDGILKDTKVDYICVSFTHIVQNLAAGTHRFKLQWRTNTNGELILQPHSQFWVR